MKYEIIEVNTNAKHWQEKLVAILYFFPLINYYFSSILNSYGQSTLTVYFYIPIFIAGILSYLWGITNSPMKSLICIFVAIILFLISSLAQPKSINYMFNSTFTSCNLTLFFGIYLPSFFLFFRYFDFEYFINLSSKFCVLTLILNIIAFINYIFILEINIPEYMTFGYSAVCAVFICFYNGIQKRKRVQLGLSLIASIIILLGGCRGASVTILIFYILWLFHFLLTKNNTKSLILKFCLILCIFLLFINIKTFLFVLNNRLLSWGYQSRVLSTMGGEVYEATQSFIDLSNRDKIWSILFENINIIGHGVYGDRILIGMYAHNWLLEILIILGLPLGVLVITGAISIVFKAFRSSFQSKDKLYYFLSSCIFCILFIKYFISSSLITSGEFWIFFGIAYNLYLKFRTMDFGVEKIKNCVKKPDLWCN